MFYKATVSFEVEADDKDAAKAVVDEFMFVEYEVDSLRAMGELDMTLWRHVLSYMQRRQTRRRERQEAARHICRSWPA